MFAPVASCSTSAARPQAAAFSGRRHSRPVARQCLVVRAATVVPSEYKTVAPVGDRVLVKVDVSEEKTTSGILLPSSAQKKPTQGEITSVGSAKAVKSGDKVVYSKYAGTELKMATTEYVLLKEDDVIGIIASDNIADLKPLGDRILLEAEEATDRSEGGVILTAASKERPTLGTVVAVGSGREDEDGKIVKPNVEPGAKVLYSRYSGTEFAGPDDTAYVVVRESDILATVA